MSSTSTDSTRIARPVPRSRAPIIGIMPSDLYVKMSMSSSITIIDIRPLEDVKALFIRGTINIPDSKTTALVHSVAESSSVVLVCADGTASRASCTTLRFCGYDHVIPLEGGLKAWEAAGLEIVRSADAPAPAVGNSPVVTARPGRSLLAAGLIAFALLFMGCMLWSNGILDSVPPAAVGEAHLENAHPPEEGP